MADTKLSYWENWVIGTVEADGGSICRFDFRGKYPYLGPEIKVNSAYLLEVLAHHPSPLEDEWLNAEVVRRSKLATKSAHDREIYNKILKCLSIDGRKQKLRSKDDWDSLVADIRSDIRFFRDVLGMRKPGETDEQVIARRIAGRNHDHLEELAGWTSVYYAYLAIYNELKTTLNNEEIFRFFDNAAEHVDKPMCIIFTLPADGCRDLILIKNSSAQF